MTAPYDVPEMVSELAALLITPPGQEFLVRLLGEKGVTIEQLRQFWAESPKVEPPYDPEEEL